MHSNVYLWNIVFQKYQNYGNRIMKLNRDFYLRTDVVQIAKDLIGKVIYTNFDNNLSAGIISETEAYAGIEDRASHAFNNRRTKRTEVMFGNGGYSYVYLCYGVHSLFNFVTNQIDIPHAVLLRGIIPFSGLDVMKKRTNKNPGNKGFSDGPGKVTNALGINLAHNKLDLLKNTIWVEDQGINISEKDILPGPRIGVQYAGEDAKLAYRFLLKESLL